MSALFCDAFTLVSADIQLLDQASALWQRSVVAPAARALPPWVTPDGLSFGRFILAGVIGVLLFTGHSGLALAAYAVALATDALDGGVARLRGRVTRFGARLDPTVDKVLHAAAFLAFLREAPLLITVVLMIDAVLFLLGLLLVARGVDTTASPFGKWKLTLQAGAVLALFWNTLQPPRSLPSPVVEGLLGAALVFAVLSGIGYAARFRSSARLGVILSSSKGRVGRALKSPVA